MPAQIQNTQGKDTHKGKGKDKDKDNYKYRISTDVDANTDSKHTKQSHYLPLHG